MTNTATLPRLFHSINLQVSAHTELKPSLRKRIKAAGGDYSDVRGAYTTTRHINLRTGDMELVAEVFETLHPHIVILTSQTFLAAACYDTVASAAERGIGLHVVTHNHRVIDAPKGTTITLDRVQAHLDRLFGTKLAHAEKVLAAQREWEQKQRDAQLARERTARLEAKAEDLLTELKGLVGSMRHNNGKIERSNSEMERIENLIKEIEG